MTTARFVCDICKAFFRYEQENDEEYKEAKKEFEEHNCNLGYDAYEREA